MGINKPSPIEKKPISNPSANILNLILNITLTSHHLYSYYHINITFTNSKRHTTATNPVQSR